MKKALLVLLLIIALLSLTACKPKENPPVDPDPNPAGEGDPSPPSISLNDWAGTWNSFHSYLADPALEATYEQLATAKESELAAVKAEIEALYQSDLVAVVIAGDTLSFYEKQQGDPLNAADKLADVSYSYAGELPGGNHTWYKFVAEGEAAAFPILLLSAVRDEVPGTTLRHFYFLYGEDVDAMLAVENWAPLLVNASSQIDLIAGYLSPLE